MKKHCLETWERSIQPVFARECEYSLQWAANDILRKASAYFAQADLDRRPRRWWRSSMSTGPSTESSRSAGCYRSLRRPTTRTRRAADPSLRSERAQRDAMLKGEIDQVWEQNFQVCGAERVWRQLNREGPRASASSITLTADVQYLSIRCSERPALAGTEPSVGSRGDSYDNAPAESTSSSPPSSGSGGSITTACSDPSATFPRPSRRKLITFDFRLLRSW